MTTNTREREWLWGWDTTQGIVSVWAEPDGRAWVWRRDPVTNQLSRDAIRYRPWALLDRIDDLQHLGPGFGPEGESTATIRYRELDGPGALRFLVTADDGRALTAAILAGASLRTGERIRSLRDLGPQHVLALSPEEQYLVASGRTYFRDLAFDQIHRLQFDLETTGLDPRRDRVFMASIRYHSGATEVLESSGENDADEAALILQLAERIRKADPDVIENHNLHGFDLPFLDRRARTLGIPLRIGRGAKSGLRQRAARRGAESDDPDDRRKVRFVAPGREFIDTLDAVRRHDFSTRELPGHGLKAVAKHLGIAAPDREYIRGDLIYTTYRTDPERVRRYATDDVEEVAGLSRMLGGAAYALAQMAPRRYERLADAGPATGVIDPLLVRAYMRAGAALPVHEIGDGTVHSGAALHLFAAGVAHRIVKADVASLYPSLMRSFRIGPSRDRIGAMLTLVDGLVEHRLEAKARARTAPAGSDERYSNEAVSAALKIVVNSAYGYLAAGGGLTRFADVHAANEVTRRGREMLGFMCRELHARGVTLLEADTDGVYFSVPVSWSEEDERRVVREVGDLLPPLIQLEFEGRYAAMLSHEPKNYALLKYDGSLIVRGVAFRSSRSEPFGDSFLRCAIAKLLIEDIAGIQQLYVSTISALRKREIPTFDVSSKVRLTKKPEQYDGRKRRELPYEAMLAAGHAHWRAGERIRVYRKQNGEAGLVDPNDDAALAARDYDVEYYVRLLRDSFASRLARAFLPDDFTSVFMDPDQFSLFSRPADSIRPILTPHEPVPAAPA